MKASWFYIVGLVLFGVVSCFLILRFFADDEPTRVLDYEKGEIVDETSSDPQVVNRNVSKTVDLTSSSIHRAAEVEKLEGGRSDSFVVELRFITHQHVAEARLEVLITVNGSESKFESDELGNLTFSMTKAGGVAIRVPERDFSTSVVLSAESSRRFIVIPETFGVLVRVVDEKADPLANAEVWKAVPMLERVAAVLVGSTDAEGKLFARGLQQDDYLQARHRDGLVSQAESWASRDASGLTLVARPAARRIHAIVLTEPRDREGEPLPLQLLAYADAHGHDRGQSFSGLCIPMWEQDGSYLALAPQSRWNWRVDAIVGQRRLQTRWVPKTSPEEVTVTLDFAGWKSIRLQVVDRKDNPVAGAHVLVRPFNSGPESLTDEEGRTEICLSPELDRIELSAWHEKRGSTQTSFERSALTGEVKVVLDREISFFGRVLTTSGMPVGRQLLYFHAVDVDYFKGLMVETNDLGEFQSLAPREENQTQFSLSLPRQGEIWAQGPIPETAAGAEMLIRVPAVQDATCSLRIKVPTLSAAETQPRVRWSRPRSYGNQWDLPPGRQGLVRGGLAAGSMHVWYQVKGEGGRLMASKPCLLKLEPGRTTDCELGRPKPLGTIHLAANRELELLLDGEPCAAFVTSEDAAQNFELPAASYELRIYRAGSTAVESRHVTLEAGGLIEVE